MSRILWSTAKNWDEGLLNSAMLRSQSRVILEVLATYISGPALPVALPDEIYLTHHKNLFFPYFAALSLKCAMRYA
jgi:hypothetical protein